MSGKRNNAVGVKGKSGRKSDVDERVRSLVINKSWDRILKKFETQDKNEKKNIVDIDLNKQLDYIAIEIAKKTIPQQIEGDLSGELTIKWADK